METNVKAPFNYNSRIFKKGDVLSFCLDGYSGHDYFRILWINEDKAKLVWIGDDTEITGITHGSGLNLTNIDGISPQTDVSIPYINNVEYTTPSGTTRYNGRAFGWYDGNPSNNLGPIAQIRNLYNNSAFYYVNPSPIISQTITTNNCVYHNSNFDVNNYMPEVFTLKGWDDYNHTYYYKQISLMKTMSNTAVTLPFAPMSFNDLAAYFGSKTASHEEIATQFLGIDVLNSPRLCGFLETFNETTDVSPQNIGVATGIRTWKSTDTNLWTASFDVGSRFLMTVILDLSKINPNWFEKDKRFKSLGD